MPKAKPARNKKASAKKPANKAPAKKAPAKKAPAKKAPAKKAPAKKAPAKKQAPAASAVEKQVAQLLQDNDEGLIDNAFDVIGDMYELDKQLPKTSSLRPAFDAMYQEIQQICVESAGG